MKCVLSSLGCRWQDSTLFFRQEKWDRDLGVWPGFFLSQCLSLCPLSLAYLGPQTSYPLCLPQPLPLSLFTVTSLPTLDSVFYHRSAVFSHFSLSLSIFLRSHQTHKLSDSNVVPFQAENMVIFLCRSPCARERGGLKDFLALSLHLDLK